MALRPAFRLPPACARFGARHLCVLADAALPEGLRASKCVDIALNPLDAKALQPAADSGPLKAVGLGDRGSGLQYRMGRELLPWSNRELAACAAARSVTCAPVRQHRLGARRYPVS